MANRFWIGGTGNWSDTTHWALTSGGAGGLSVPVAADDVTFDANSGAGTMTVDATANVGTLNMRAYLGGVTLNAGIISNGNVILPSPAITLAGAFGLTMTPASGVTATLTTNMSKLNGGLAVQGADGTAVISLADTLILAGTLSHLRGILRSNNNQITASALASNNASARTLDLGSSLITLFNNIFNTADFATATNLTITANTATLRFTGGGGVSLPNGVNFNGLSLLWTGGGTATGLYGNSACTFRNLTYYGAAKTDLFTFANAVTFTGNVSFSGLSAAQRILVGTNSGAGAGGSAPSVTVTVQGVFAPAWADFQDLNFAVGGTPSFNTLTLSGNEITYQSRLNALLWGVNQQGGSTDTSTPTGFNGFASWEAGTNLFRRGQCDATTDYNIASTGVVTRTVDATMPAPFSTQSIKYVTDGTAASQGILADTATGLGIAVAGTMCVGSAYFKGVAGQTYFSRLRLNYTDTTQDLSASQGFTATGLWQLIIPLGFATAATKTLDRVRVEIFINGTRAETFWVAHPMIQTGVAVVSPYVATSGGVTSGRPAARMQAPSNLFGAAAGGFAIRIKMGFDDISGTGISFNPRMFGRQDGTNSRLLLLYDRAGKTFAIESQTGGGTFAIASIASGSFTKDTAYTIVCQWDAAFNIYISVNGSIFTIVSAVGKFPALADVLFDIANGNGSSQLNGNTVWAATFNTAGLTNADAVTINGYGDNPPARNAFPGSCTAVFSMVTSTYQDNTGVTGALVGDAQGNNAGIVFTTSAQQTWQGTASGNWSDNTKWTSRVPLPQDDVIINAPFVAAQTITADVPRLGRNIDFTGVSGTPIWSRTISCTVYGSLTLAAGLSNTASSQNIIFAGRNGNYTITTVGKLANAAGGYSTFIRALGGTYTLLDDFITAQAGVTTTFSIQAGTFDANTHNVSCGIATCAGGTLVRTVKFGSGIWTLWAAGAQNVWAAATVGNGCTIIPGTAIIDITATDAGLKTFTGSAQSYPTLRFRATGGGSLSITGNNIFISLDIEASTAKNLTLGAPSTQTINGGALILKGAVGQALSPVSAAPGTQVVIDARSATSFQLDATTTPSADVRLFLPLQGEVDVHASTESGLLVTHTSSDDAHTSAGDIFNYGEVGSMRADDFSVGTESTRTAQTSNDVGRGIDSGDFFNIPGWVTQKYVINTPTSLKVVTATNIRLKVVGMADVGSEVVLQATFTDRSGLLVDPYVVKGSVKQPDGTAVNLNLARVSLGVYEATFVITQDGPHWWRAQGNGNVKAASEKSFIVPKEMVPAV